MYSHTLDLFVALTAAATATKTLRIGCGICLVIQRDPIVLAKEVASLDHISGGRVLFGVGGGWNREEMANHGTDFTTRWSLMRERIEAMKAIWSEEAATYHGRFVNFDAIWSWPKPVQKPHPPILVGGNGEHTLQRVLRYGDEWLPLGRREQRLGERIQELQALAREAGRPEIPVSLYGVVSRDPADLEAFQRDGVSRCFLSILPEDRDTVLSKLDALVELIRPFA
jgi:probable F420-dependent oxidoreductase